MLLGIIRRAVTLSQARRVEAQYGDRVLRESTTLRVAVEVWSDVASTRGLGFRSGDSGPLLHGDLASGGAFEMGVYSREEDGQYATLATVRLPSPLPGQLVLRPHEPWTRALAAVRRPPAELPAELTSTFHVRAKPSDLATRVLTPKLQALLALLADRNPQIHAGGDEVSLVLEGVELAHERVEAIVDAFDTLFPVATGPYRR